MRKSGASAKSGGSSNTPAQRTDRTSKINCLFDWIGFTFLNEDFSIDAALEVFNKLLGISYDSWINGPKYYEGYAFSKRFENITIYFEGASNQGIHVDISGQGCRYLDQIYKKLRVPKLEQDEKPNVHMETEQMNWFIFLSYIDSMDTKFTRIDVAIDDFLEYFTVPYIFQKCLRGEFTSKFKSWSPDGYFGTDGRAKEGMTLYFGSDVSRIQICMYEKGKQLGIDQKWTRTEIRYRHERATQFIKLFLAQRDSTQFFEMGVIAAGVLKDYLTFREPNSNDSNKRRWKVSPFWEQFLDGIEPVKLGSGLPDRSIVKMRYWLNKGVSKTIATLFFAYQDINDNWLKEVFEEGKKKLTIRELNMIEEFRRSFDSEVAATIDNSIDVSEHHRKKSRSVILHADKTENKNTRQGWGAKMTGAVKNDN